MEPNKTHEGCIVILASKLPDQSRLKYKIEAIDERTKTMKYRYYTYDNQYSKEVLLRCYEGYSVVELVERYGKPVNFFHELNIVLVEMLHMIMARLKFNMN